MAEVQDWHRPRQARRRCGPRERSARPRRRRSGGTARTAAARQMALAGKYGEGQGRQHTERAGHDRSDNAGYGVPRVDSGPFLRLLTLFMTGSWKEWKEWKEWKDPPRFGQNLWINSRLASASRFRVIFQSPKGLS
jgi:hypothetical protein